MTDIRPGIYKIGNMQIIAISDELIGIGWLGKEPLTMNDLGQIKRDLKVQFPNMKTVLYGNGSVSYEALLGSSSFREAVITIVDEHLKEDGSPHD